MSCKETQSSHLFPYYPSGGVQDIFSKLPPLWGGHSSYPCHWYYRVYCACGLQEEARWLTGSCKDEPRKQRLKLFAHFKMAAHKYFGDLWAEQTY